MLPHPTITLAAAPTNASTTAAPANYWCVPGFPTASTPPGGAPFNSGLSPQLKMIARLIEAGHRSLATGGFGMLRQIFFCQVGGYDLHTGQTQVVNNVVDTTQGSHTKLLAEISQALLAFPRAMGL